MVSGYQQLVDLLKERHPNVSLRDFRSVSSWRSVTGIRETREGDPLGCTEVDLGMTSFHSASETTDRFRVTNYDPGFMGRHHSHGKHSYLIANSVLRADAVISVPKWKTHSKAGITCALKNLVGINCFKDCLPHHKRGSVSEGGDEYNRRSRTKDFVTTLQEFEDVQDNALARISIKIPKKALRLMIEAMWSDKLFEGCWSGNDTIWRTALDLNRILFYWDQRQGCLHETPVRHFLTIVDGIVAGEGEGPLAVDPRWTGLLFGGFNPVAVDTVAARLMDFDWRRIPLITNAYGVLTRFGFSHIECISSNIEYSGNLLIDTARNYFQFHAAKGWKGQIELRKKPVHV